MRRPTPCTQYPYGLQRSDGLLGPLEKEDRPTMDGSKGQPKTTAGLDIGDKYSYPCASSIRTVARLWRKVGCAPPPRHSDDASSASGPCA